MGNKGLRIALRVILALSLLLNAVLVGLFLRLNAVRTELGFSDLPLSRAERLEFRRTAAADPGLRDALATMREARAAMFETLAAEPVDQEATDAAMADVRAATNALQVELQRVLLTVLD